MGREIRRVPSWWEHPRDSNGRYLPCFDRSYDEALRDYRYCERLWEEGRHPSQLEWPYETQGLSFKQWDDELPDPKYYRKESWTEADAVQVQLYETITEGTPVSPRFDTVTELLAWMLTNWYTEQDIADIQNLGILPTLWVHQLAREPLTIGNGS